MLKGKTTIELTDVNTGEKKVYEDHNMVTNALNMIFKQYGYAKDGTNLLSSNNVNNTFPTISLYPFYQNALGGLLLFDETIDENGGNTVFAPTSAEMVGCGVYSKTSTNDVRGSYNSSESYYNSNEKTMKYVYDFATNQANGTIKSVCLTSAYGGYGLYGHESFSNSNEGNYFYYDLGGRIYDFRLSNGLNDPFAIDLDKNSAYYYKIDGTTNIIIYEYDLPFKTIKIFNSPTIPRLKNQTSYPIDIPYSEKSVSYDQKLNSIYVFSSAFNANSIIKVTKIDLSDGTTSNYTFTNSTGARLANDTFVYDGYVYLKGYSSTTMYRCKIGSETIEEIGTMNDTYAFSAMVFNGRLNFFNKGNSNASSICTYNPYKKTFYKTPLKFSGSYNYFTPLLGSSDLMNWGIYTNGKKPYLCGFCINPSYLATINNLETPIVKTDTNTMKVIYTISEV